MEALPIAPRPAPREPSAREEIVADLFAAIMEAHGLDLRSPDLRDTPRRVARSFEELLAALSEPEPELTTFPNGSDYSEPVVLSRIPFHSLCAHHFLPFFGEARIAYLPGDRIVGLSKPARVVGYLSRQPQVQERLTDQIAELLQRKLRPRALAVWLRARHLCMEMRGVGQAAWTETSAVRGEQGPALSARLR
jgi:GTP cyclohydrolase I